MIWATLTVLTPFWVAISGIFAMNGLRTWYNLTLQWPAADWRVYRTSRHTWRILICSCALQAWLCECRPMPSMIQAIRQYNCIHSQVERYEMLYQLFISLHRVIDCLGFRIDSVCAIDENRRFFLWEETVYCNI